MYIPVITPWIFGKRVVFVDEKSFRSDQSGRVHVWRPNGTRFSETNVNAVRRSGHISVNMFGWVSANGVGELSLVENRLTGKE